MKYYGRITDNKDLVTKEYVDVGLSKIACRPNLLDNWYFVGGGAFPINERGQSSYTGASSYTINRWGLMSGVTDGTVQPQSDGLLLTKGESLFRICQPIPIRNIYNKTFTLSALIEIVSGEFQMSVGETNTSMVNQYGRYVSSSTSTSGLFVSTGSFSTVSDLNNMANIIILVNSGAVKVKAVKLELGDTQTLVHQENGAWVLNEIPDYEEQLIRCKTSMVDKNDAYSNHPISFQPNKNLLCNSYWNGIGSQEGVGNFPINTRGLLNYSAGQYTIDKWYLYNSGYVRVHFQGAQIGIRLESTTGGAAVLRQAIPIDGLKGKTVTFSMYDAVTNFGDVNMKIHIGLGNDSTGAVSTVLGSAHIDRVTTLTVTIPSDTQYKYLTVYIYLPARASTGNAILLRGCKLELGDQQTLGQWDGSSFVFYDSPPDYDEEVVRCRTNLSDPSDTYANDSVAFKSSIEISKIDDTSIYASRKLPTGVETTEVLTELTGSSVGWNQLAQWIDASDKKGLTITHSNGKITVSGTPTSAGNVSVATVLITIPANHVVLLQGLPAGLSNIKLNRYIGVQMYDQGYGAIAKTTQNISSLDQIRLILSSTTTAYNFSFYPQFFDLTLMFGATIADYILSLESGTAGAGVAWLKEHGLIDGAYHAYDAGSIQSVNLSSHDTVGFNVWDEQWEEGSYYVGNGNKAPDSGYIRCANKIPVIPGQDYYFCVNSTAKTFNGRVLGYYKNGSYYKEIMTIFSRGFTIHVPTNVFFITWYSNSSYGLPYTNDICINVFNSNLNGTYKPYVLPHSYPLDASLQLRGIPKLDANNVLYYDGDTYRCDGRVVRKYGIVDLGSLTWAIASGSKFYASNDIGMLRASGRTCVCSRYTSVNNINDSSVVMADKTICGINNGSVPRIYIQDSSYNTTDALKTALSGVYLVYELASPTVEQADSFTSNQSIDPDGTESFVGGLVPPQAEARFPTGYAAKVADVLMPISAEMRIVDTERITVIPQICEIEKYGNMRTLVITGNGITLPQTTAVIPEGHRPRINICFPCATQSNGDLYWGRIMTDGTITLFKAGNPVTTSTNFMIFNVSWLVL